MMPVLIHIEEILEDLIFEIPHVDRSVDSNRMSEVRATMEA